MRHFTHKKKFADLRKKLKYLKIVLSIWCAFRLTSQRYVGVQKCVHLWLDALMLFRYISAYIVPHMKVCRYVHKYSHLWFYFMPATRSLKFSTELCLYVSRKYLYANMYVCVCRTKNTQLPRVSNWHFVTNKLCFINETHEKLTHIRLNMGA